MPHSADEGAHKRQLKLISVSFKEASLDSPSFRASVNFFHTRIEVFEDRLQKTIDFFDHKYKQSFEDFQRTKEIMMAQLFPSPVMLSNGIVANQSVTPALIADFNRDYKAFSDKLLKVMISEGNSHSVALLDFMTDAVEPYKNNRKSFEYYQVKYDEMTETYLAMRVSNTQIEPAAIKRDAMQLFEVRKNYLTASLDLVESIANLKLSFDKYLADSMAILRTNNMFQFKDSGRSIDLCPQVDSYFEDYLSWVENALAAGKTLEQDIHHAKKLIYDYALHQIQPSQNVEDYNVRSINSATLVPRAPTTTTPVKPQEKNGWLFMKTTVGKPPRTIWVRRWCFLQNGVFGMFLLAPSKIYVEETDKFGICLTATRYDMEEDRKFCFELKVFNGSTAKQNGNSTASAYKPLSIVLQADSLRELKSWLTTFSAGRKYIETLEKGSTEHELAFKRFSPQFFEFASSTTTSVDQLITTFDSKTKSLLGDLNGTFSEYENLTLGDDKPYQFHMDITPISTKMSQLAVLSNFCSNGSWFPNAVLANIWGSTNWTEYALFSDVGANQANNSSMPRNLVIGSPVKYPPYFTKVMRVTDLQFKSIFFAVNSESVLKNEQFALFKFTSFWYPNSKQRFSAICYVTLDHVFAYMNTMGFICLVRLNFADIVSIEIDKAEPNRLVVYNTNGLQYRIHVIFDDCRAVAAKLQMLVVNSAEKSVKSQEALLAKFKQIDAEYVEKRAMDNVLKEQKRIDDIINADLSKAINSQKKMQQSTSQNTANVDDSRLINNSSFWSMSESAEAILERRKETQRTYNIMYRHDYDIPSKGLMHILFGDQSNAFPRCLFLAYNNGRVEGNTYWNKQETADGKDMLVRKIKFQLNTTQNIFNGRIGISDNTGQVVSLEQRIVKMVENKYYEVEQEPVFIKLPLCHPLRVMMKIIILEQYDPENHVASKLQMPTAGSMLNLFYKIDFVDANTEKVVTKLNTLEKLLKRWTLAFTNTEYLLFRKIIRYYLERIGKHGKIIKTIKLCGLLGVTKDSITEEKKSSPEKDGEKKPVDQKGSGVKETVPAESNGKTITEHNLVNYSLLIMLKVFLKIVFYRIANITLLLLRFVVGVIIVICRSFSNINRVLLFMLLISAILNFFLSGKSSVSYWTVKRAEKTFRNFADQNAIENNKPKSKAIFIKDLDLLTKNLATEKDNPAFTKFNTDESSKDPLFQQTRNDLAIRRNQLLVELKILQNMEREVVQGSYRKFLLKEIDSCLTAKNELTEVYESNEALQKYCASCSSELERLTQLLL